MTRRVCSPLLVLLAACGPAPETGPAAAAYRDAVPAFRPLAAVRLGMRAEEIRALRPSARPAEYVGALEVVGGDTVAYRLTGWMDHSDAPDWDRWDGERLVALEDQVLLPTDAAADSAWRARVSALRALGKPTCAHIRYPLSPVLAAWLAADGATLGATRRVGRHVPNLGGAIWYPARVHSFATRDVERILPSSSVARDTVPCP